MEFRHDGRGFNWRRRPILRWMTSRKQCDIRSELPQSIEEPSIQRVAVEGMAPKSSPISVDSIEERPSRCPVRR